MGAIPASFSQPGVYINLTINDSTGNDDTFNVLFLGQAATGSTYASNPAIYPVTSLSQLATDFGSTSDIYKMISEYQTIDPTTTLYALNCIVGDVTSTTSNGTIEEITSQLTTTSQSTDMASASVSATGGTGTGATFSVTSSKNADGSAFTPASVALVSGGAGYKIGDKLTIANVGTITVTGLDSETVTTPQSDSVTLTNALANVGNMEFDILVGTFNSTEALQAIDNYFTGTWGYEIETYGHYFTVNQNNDVTQLVKDGANFNFETCSVLAMPTDLDLYSTIGSWMAQTAIKVQENPSLPLRNFSLDTGVVSIANRWNVETRQQLYNNGYCTILCDSAGNSTVNQTRIGATTEDGVTINDVSLETRFQAVYVAKTVRSALTPYTNGGKIIMNDNDIVSPSPYVITPSSINSACIGIYSTLINELICTDLATFKKGLSVTIDTNVIGRIDIVFPATLAQSLNQITINLSTSK